MKLTIAALTLLISQALAQTCPAGFVGFEGSCYFFVSSRLTFFQADQYCTSLVGEPYENTAHLVSIESFNEDNFLKNSARSNGEIRGRDLWMGGTQIDSSRGWVWTRTNQRFSYANWDGSPGSAYCGYMREFYDYKWRDTDCKNRKAFICEYTPSRTNEIEEYKETYESEPQANCAPGFIEYGGHCYFIVPSSLDWYESDRFCTFLYPGTSYKVHLASIESEAEQNFLVMNIRNNGQYNSRNYWTSGNNMERGRSWHWASSDKDFTYFTWAPGQPDNSGQCVMMYKDRGYTWDDYTCTDKNAAFTPIGFICEYDPRDL